MYKVTSAVSSGFQTELTVFTSGVDGASAMRKGALSCALRRYKTGAEKSSI